MPSRPEASSGGNVNQPPNPHPSAPAEETDPTGFVPFQDGVAPQTDGASKPTRSLPAQPIAAPKPPVPPPLPATHSIQKQPTPPPVSSRTNPSTVGSKPAQRTAQPELSQVSASQSATTYRPEWRQAGRAKQWPSQSRSPRLELILVQGITAIVLVWGLQSSLHWLSYQLTMALTQMGFRLAMPASPFWLVLIGLTVLFFSSRWLLDALLTRLDGLQPLSIEQLARYSPEASRSFKRYCQQQQVAVPVLGLLPTAAPIAFTYGFLPRYSRLVVSQGLLQQLSDDEIAAIIARETGNLAAWTVPLLSLITALLLLPFTVYRVVADWGDRQPTLWRGLAIAVSGLSYSLFWLLRWFGLWLSRQRVEESDRRAVTLTGHPNGLMRGLLKIAIGTANDLKQRGATADVLEGFELLAPLGYRMAIPLGSLYPYTPLAPLLEQEQTNPYKRWLSINATHPVIGDRLAMLAQTARQWRLLPELDLSSSTPNRPRSIRLTPAQRRSLLLQTAPWVGILAGILVALLLALIGWTALQFKFPALAWMQNDPALIRGLPLIGFCLGTFVRLNPFFPDIPKVGTFQAVDETLVEQILTIGPLPIQGQPTELSGKLLGRGGIRNRLHQDLWLHTRSGIVRLHCISAFGPLGDLLPHPNRPERLKNQDIIISGWLRRGLSPWLDVEQIRALTGRTMQSYHPAWSVIAAVLVALMGLYILASLGLQ